MILDFSLAFSGQLTYSDGSKSSLEAYYSSKGGNYTVDQPGGLATTRQIVHANSGSWETDLLAFLSEAFNVDASLGAVLVGIDAPATTKTITDGVFHVRGMIAEDDNTKHPISATYTRKAGNVSFVTTADQAVWASTTDQIMQNLAGAIVGA